MLHIAQHKSKISLPKIAFPEALPQKILLFKRSLQKFFLKTLLYSLFLPGGNVFSNFFIKPPLQPLLSHTSSPFSATHPAPSSILGQHSSRCLRLLLSSASTSNPASVYTQSLMPLLPLLHCLGLNLKPCLSLHYNPFL